MKALIFNLIKDVFIEGLKLIIDKKKSKEEKCICDEEEKKKDKTTECGSYEE